MLAIVFSSLNRVSIDPVATLTLRLWSRLWITGTALRDIGSNHLALSYDPGTRRQH
jgi:hypothetical protein